MQRRVIMSETLTQFGTSFQSKIVASLLSDIKFLQTINDILEPNMFDSDSNKWLIKTIRNYYFEYKNITKLQKKQLFDYKNWLPNDLLVKLDRCLMAFSLEGRTPFIDKNMFREFFFVEDSLKIRSGFGKFYIRKKGKLI